MRGDAEGRHGNRGRHGARDRLFHRFHRPAIAGHGHLERRRRTLDIGGRHHAARTRAAESIDVGTGLGSQPARQRRGLVALRARCRCGARGGRHACRGRCCRDRLGCCCRLRRCGCSDCARFRRAGIDVGFRFHQVADRMGDRHHGIHRGQRSGQVAVAEHLDVHDGLVGLDRGDDVAALDRVADVLFPADNDTFRHGVGQLGHLDYVGFSHGVSPFQTISEPQSAQKINNSRDAVRSTGTLTGVKAHLMRDESRQSLRSALFPLCTLWQCVLKYPKYRASCARPRPRRSHRAARPFPGRGCRESARSARTRAPARHPARRSIPR